MTSDADSKFAKPRIKPASSDNRCGTRGFDECLINRLACEANSADTDRCVACGKSMAELDGQIASIGSSLRHDTHNSEIDAAQLGIIEHRIVRGLRHREFFPPREIGPYQIREELGRGGMGAVYKATHQHLKKDVAIKLLPMGVIENRGVLARFEREMEAVGKLDHPNVVRAMDAGREDGNSFLIMEMLVGVDLAQLTSNGRSLKIADACELARQAATGLQYAHTQGLVHRDVKPANLMLTNDSLGKPLVKIMDLGLALLTETESFDPLTDQGQLMGTLEFMAPEQASHTSCVDNRADIYALGATLFRLLSGTVPFGGREYNSPMKRLNALAHQQTPSLASRGVDLPPELVQLVDQMLARDPKARPQSMAEVADRLSPFAVNQNLGALCSQKNISCDLQASDTLEMVDAKGFLDDTTPSAGPTQIGKNVNKMNDSVLDRPKSHERAAPQNHSRNTEAKVETPRWKKSIAAAAVLLPVLLIFAGIVWLKTDGGYIRIDADPSVEVTIEIVDVEENHAEKSLKSFDVGREHNRFWVRSGHYRIKLPADAQDSFTIKNSELKVSRGSQQTATISLLDSKPSDEMSDSGPRPIDSLASNRDMIVKWVLSKGGDLWTSRGNICKESDIPNGEYECHRIGLPDVNDRTALQVARWMNLLPKCDCLFLDGGHSARLTDSSMSAINGIQRLKWLSITSRNVTDDGILKFNINQNLTTLILNVRLTEAGLRHVAEVFPNIALLGLTLRASALSDLQPLSEMSELRTFDLTVDAISPDLMQTIGKLNCVELIFRGAQKFEDGSLEALSKMTSLKTISIQNCLVSDEQLLELVDVVSVKELSLDGTNVTISGLTQFLKRRKDIRVLTYHPDSPLREMSDHPQVMVGINFGPNAEVDPVEPNDRPLQTDPDSWPAQISDRELADWLLQNGGGFHTRTSSLIRGKDAQIPGGDFQITSIQIYNASGKNLRKLTGWMTKMPACTELYLTGSGDLSLNDDCISSLNDISHLTKLTLQYCQVTDAGIARLKNLTRLDELGLTEIQLTVKGLNHIQQTFPELSAFEFRLATMDAQLIEPVSMMEKLRHLCIGTNEFTTKMADVLARSSVTHLTLRDIQSFAPDAISELAKSRQLEYLALAVCKPQDRDLEQIAGVKTLRVLNFDDSLITANGLLDFMKTRPDVELQIDYAAPVLQQVRDEARSR